MIIFFWLNTARVRWCTAYGAVDFFFTIYPENSVESIYLNNFANEVATTNPNNPESDEASIVQRGGRLQFKQKIIDGRRSSKVCIH